ncbi:chain length determinant protein [Sphingobium limneticum]|uniref:Wzz/FepE/Etk N-terminal domain-containing protein n=1 Tax=Sphingobium limneticum TaxID=1007511 RepID=UPI00123DA239|nr:Wzz/FepE/Etk N-terminal domain-containing protein [Sphingobium limneticum]KAA9013030.1 chain length determinant protein [Sphingobium limneticum]
MSFVQFFRILWAYRFLILLTTFACVGGAFIFAKLIPDRYEAHSRVMLDVMKPDPITGDVISNSFARAYTKTQIELITDYRFAGAVVDELGWAKVPAFKKAYEAQARPGDGGFRRWLTQMVIANTAVRLIPATAILDISYSSSSPEAARKVADAIRKSYVDQSVNFRQEGASSNAAWFRQQGESLREQLTAAQERKTAYEKANGIVLQDDWSDTDTSRLKALSSQLPTPALGPAMIPQASPAQAQLAQLDAQITTIARTLGPNHPELVALRNSRASLAATAAREQSQALAAARGSVAGGPSIDGQVAAQQNKVLANREKIDELRKMQAVIDVLRAQAQKVMGRAAELGVEAESTESGLTMLGSAVAPAAPSWPNVPMITGVALMAGFILGILIALASELLGRRVRGPEDLGMTGVPVIGVIVGFGQKAGRKGWQQRLGFRRPGMA